MKEIPITRKVRGKSEKVDWKKEVVALQRIKCRNVLNIVDWFEDDYFGYIIMELCKDGTLGDEIERRREEGKSFTEKVRCLVGFCFVGGDGVGRRVFRLSLHPQSIRP